MCKYLFPVLALLLLAGCKVHMAGHTDDWSDIIVGEADLDPFSGYGTATVRFEKSRITCNGNAVPSREFRGVKASLLCSDGRRLEVDSYQVEMTSGHGRGSDDYGYTGQFVWSTESAPMAAEADTYRREVASRNVSIEPFMAKLRRGQQPAGAGAGLPPAPPPAPAVAATAPAQFATAQSLPVQAVAGPSQRIALVIGNSAYKDVPLRNPVNDARLMAARLREVGFEVMPLENGVQRDMNRALTRFGERLNPQTMGPFFYAGHGMQVRGRNFLVPVDASITTEASVRNESVDIDQVLDQMSGSGSPLNLVILDACRNNPFERRFRGASGGLAQIDAPKGTLIAFSTAPGRVAADGDGSNSVYTEALARALSEAGAPVETVFKRVRNEVSRVSRDTQIPWESSSLTGDFYFVAAPR